MIKKLHRKFILISMLAVTFVLIVIMSAINILNYRSVVTDADRMLTMVAGRSNAPGGPGTTGSGTGIGPSGSKSKPGTKSDSGSGSTSDSSTDSDTDSAANPPSDPDDSTSSTRGFQGNLPFDSRSFSVILDEDGNEVFVDMRDTVSVSESTALTYAKKILKSGKTRGFLNGYRYLVSTNTQGAGNQDSNSQNTSAQNTSSQNTGSQTEIDFVDCQKSLANARSFLMISVLVSLCGLLAVFVLIFFFSRMIMKPVEESYKKQKRFITDAGHELKTPLAIIDADASVLEMDIGENEWITDLKKQTKRMADLTKDLIYLSRMDEGSAKLVMMDFPLSDVVTETAQSFRSRAQLAKKSFEVNVQPMISFFGDEKAIRQLIGILLDNALKYSNEGGNIQVDLSKQNHRIELSVWNTADSIDRESLPRLFDRFYRADSSRNSETGGYGIGLSMAQAIVEAHKGKIQATSSDGKSICLKVTLPLKAPAYVSEQ